MRVSALIPLLGAPLLAYALDPNPFNIPATGLSAKGGVPLNLSWQATTLGTVSLVLRSGSSTDLLEGTVIASKIANTGSFTWTPSNSLTTGTDYAIEIVDDADPTETNYTPQFALDTTNTQTASTSIVTFGPPTVTITTSRPTGTGGLTSGLTNTTSSSIHLSVHNPFSHKTTATGASLTTLTSTTAATSSQAASTTSSAGAARVTALAGGVLGLALGILAF